MKACNPVVCFLLILFLGYCSLPIMAQVDSLDYISVSGIVKDGKTKKKLSSVNISIPGTHIGTVTNEDGFFTLKMKKMYPKIVCSHLGYKNQDVVLQKDNLNNIAILLMPYSSLISEVVVLGINPVEIIEKAFENVPENNSKKTNTLTGFYRETAQKGRKFINVSEAIVNIYKTPYKESINKDRVEILKGRRLVSQKASDTLGVKLIGGPTLCIYADIAKNRDAFLSKDQLKYYSFKMEESSVIDNKPQYVISFWPKVELPDEALFYGTVYINKDNLAFSRIESSLDMSSKYKAIKVMLYKKPIGLRFKPQKLSYIINYKIENGVAYINYLRNDICFKCDWKRKLFSKNYKVVSEIVVTDKTDSNIIPISYRNSFGTNDSFYDKVEHFNNDDFWESYNIIEPTESLEHAVNKLKKNQQ